MNFMKHRLWITTCCLLFGLLLAGCVTEKGWNIGVAGHTVDSNNVTTARWFFPAYQWEWNGQSGYASVLYGGIGWREDSHHVCYKHWCYPVYEKDDAAGTFETLLFCYGRDNFTIPPILSRFYGARKGTLLLGLAGYEVSRPTNSLCAPLAVSHYVFPFYGVTRRFDEPTTFSILDRRDPLVLRNPGTWGLNETRKRVSYENRDVFALLGRSSSLDVAFAAPTNIVMADGSVSNREAHTDISYDTELMVFPFYSYRTWHSVRLAGDRVVEDGGRVSSGTLLSHFERKGSRLDGSASRHDTVLYFLYDYSEEDGETSLALFPGYFHTTRPDGYTMTSLFWRVFRWESDPSTGARSLDLILLPVYRRSGNGMPQR